jgi:hypothetical protein
VQVYAPAHLPLFWKKASCEATLWRRRRVRTNVVSPRSRYNLLGLEFGAPVETSNSGDYEESREPGRSSS